MKINVMRIIIFFLLPAFTFNSCLGQLNLVPNPSFEDTLHCPDNFDQINHAIDWNRFRGTPDYFNSCCNIINSTSVPQNYFDFQYARTGNAYTGIFTYHTVTQYREFIGTQLNQPLVIGHKYFISLFVNRVGDSTGYNIATNKLGIKFSTILYSYSNPAPIDNYAHLYTDSIISDTLNWTEISGSFIADSSYQFIIVGNFFNDSLTSFIKFDTTAGAAYYFIDDVSLIDSTVQGIDILNDLGENIKIKCAPDWILVEGRGGFKLTLYDILGKEFFFKEAFDSFLIKTSKYSKGIYFLHILSFTENITKKIIIK